jgi:anti-sigma B factor antagonist
VGDDKRGRQGRHGSARWTVTTDGDRAVITLAGEIDLAAIEGPTEGILGALRGALDREVLVVCDLSEVAFMDSSGFQLLVRLKRSVEDRAGRFVLTRLTPELRRVMRIAGLDGEFEIAAES